MILLAGGWGLGGDGGNEVHIIQMYDCANLYLSQKSEYDMTDLKHLIDSHLPFFKGAVTLTSGSKTELNVYISKLLHQRSSFIVCQL